MHPTWFVSAPFNPCSSASRRGCGFVRRRRCRIRGVDGLFGEAEPPMQSGQRLRRPPVPVSHQPHRRGDEEGAHDGRVHQHREPHPEAYGLDHDRFGEAEGEKDGGHDQGGAGDETARTLDAEGNGRTVVSRAFVLFLDAAEEHHLVVHGESEQDAEHDDRGGGVDRAWGEIQQSGEVPFLEDEDQGPIGGADRQEVDDDRFYGQEHRPEEQEQHHVSSQDHESYRRWRSIIDRFCEVEVEGRPTADQDLAADGGVLPADLAHQVVGCLGVVADRGGSGQYRYMIPGGPLQRVTHFRRKVLAGRGEKLLVLLTGELRVEVHHALHPFDARPVRQPSAQIVSLPYPLFGERPSQRIIDQDHHRVSAGVGELAVQQILSPARLRVFGERIRPGEPEPDAQKRRTEHQEERDHRQKRAPRVAHDGDRQPVPETNPRVGPLRVYEGHPQEVHARAEDRQERGEKGQPVEHREGDHDRAGEAYGVQVGHIEEEEAHKAYGDRETGEQDRASRRRHRARQGVWDGMTVYLLAKTANDEERVIYGDAEPDHGDYVGRVDRDVHRPGQQQGPDEAAGDGEHANPDGQSGGDDGAEDKEQHQERQRKRDRLCPLQIRFCNPLEVFVERHLTRRDDFQGTWLHLLLEGYVGVLQLGVAALLELDYGEAVVLVAGDHGLIDGAIFVSGADPLHPLVVFERLERPLHLVAESRVCGLLILAAEDEHETGRGLRHLLI